MEKTLSGQVLPSVVGVLYLHLSLLLGLVLGISELGTFIFTWLRKDCDISIFSWIEKILPITHNSCSCYLE